MIGKIIIGKSFRGCINYCLENKKQPVQNEQLIHSRADVLTYNLCYGDKRELVSQFNEVRNLNNKLSKPVMHITLSLAPGESLSKEKLSGLVEDCAKELGFDRNQYLAITHNDTHHQHLHIIVNRIGFDGRTLSDSNNYKKMANYCRKMELKFGLQQVLSPRRYLSKEARQIPRFDNRKIKLRQHIVDCLCTCRTFEAFEQKMRQRNYIIQKARGIAFIDPKKVRIKGSEVGFPLSRIQRILGHHPELKKEIFRIKQLDTFKKNSLLQSSDFNKEHHPEKQQSLQLSSAMDLLLKPPPFEENTDPALIKKKRRKKRSQHL